MLTYSIARSAARALSGVLLAGVVARGAVLFDDQASWRYLKGVTEASAPDPTAWRESDFDDQSWLTGQAPFFYESASGYTGNTELPDMRDSYSCLFLRKEFQMQTPLPSELTLDVWTDDGCVVWLNGAAVLRVNVPDGEIAFDGVSLGALGEPNVAGIRIANADGILVPGLNVIAIQALNAHVSSSSDFLITAALSTTADVEAPEQVGWVPEAGATVSTLVQIEVVFSESVRGVDAGDLLMNGVAATNVVAYSPREYAFFFPEPPAGVVQVAWIDGHSISDLATPANAFGGGAWQYTLDPSLPPEIVLLTEFLASNNTGIRDEDREPSDWIELFNPGTAPVGLAGWSLTDAAGDLTRWRFPDVTLGAGEYLVVWASGKDRTVAGRPLHTSFRLSDAGEYLALVDSRTNVVSDYFPSFPSQLPDISYGLDLADPAKRGYFPTPTPGAPNVPGGPGFAPPPVFSLPGGVYGSSNLTVTLSSPSGVIRYTTDGSLPTETSPLYRTPIQLSANAIVQAGVFEVGLLPGPIVTQTYVLAAASVREFSSNLPILVISTDGRSIPQDVRIPATMVAIEPWRGRTQLVAPPSFQGRAQIEVRGQSSSGFPKKQYNLEVNDAYGNDLEVPLLGLPAESDWVLQNPYSDKSLLNNFLSYELHEKMGHYAVRRRYVEVFIDTTGTRLDYSRHYAGVYVLIEKIKVDANRVDIARLLPGHDSEPEITGGYIVKKDKSSPGDRVMYTEGGSGFGRQELRIHEPKPDEITSAQLSWIRDYLISFERALYDRNWLSATGTNHYSHYIDVDSFVDNHWMVEFTKQIDGYRLSNYLTKDRGGKLRMDPIWDWNLSLGNADYLEGEFTSGWYWPLIDANAHLYLRRLITGSTANSGVGDPDFVQRIIDRWGVLRSQVLAASNLVSRIDEIAAYLDEAQVREFKRWPRLGLYVWPNPQIYVTPTTYAGIIAAKKSWVQARYAWIDRQYPLPPELSSMSTYVTPGFQLSFTGSEPTFYYTTDGSDPRLPGGAVSPEAIFYTGPITVNRDMGVQARRRRGTLWGGPTRAAFLTEASPLSITEIMFRPGPWPAGSTNVLGSDEFIEFTNLGASPLDLRDYALTDGVRFSFATGNVAVLNPGMRVVVVRDPGAFAARYGTEIGVAGQYEGSLDNEGEILTLTGLFGVTAQTFRYEADWHPVTDGVGFSLVPASEGAALTDWSQSSAWRPSGSPGGSPGAVDPGGAAFPLVLINEVLTHTDLPDVDYIELYNTEDEIVDLSGWYLSDDARAPKFRIPEGTQIEPGGWVVFTEMDFNVGTDTETTFTLRASGDEVFLFSADADGTLTGYRHGFDFGAALNGVAFGRWVNSEGRELLLAQSANTPGAANAGPQVGPVVISEIMYHPPDVVANGAAWDNTEDEFIELWNTGMSDVPLFDVNVPTNSWRLRDAVKYTFPTSQVLAGGERIVVVAFDPISDTAAAAAFRSRYGVSSAVRLFGPFAGRLGNEGESVELTQPDLVRLSVTNEVVTAVLVDRVRYRDRAPWPGGADGFGMALQRVDETSPGDDAVNWVGAAPTPGAGYVPGLRPVISGQPVGQRILAGTPVTLQVEAAGGGTLNYQWRKDESNLPGETRPTLTLDAVGAEHGGRYDVVVWSNGESAVSEAAVLVVELPPVIQRQPESVSSPPGLSVAFSVVASSTSPMRFQWRHDSQVLEGADEPTLQLAPSPAPGTYDVVISNLSGSVTSSPALLILQNDSLIAQPPVAQSVPVGGSVTFGVQLTDDARPPFSYTWLRNGVTLAVNVTSVRTDFLSLTDVGTVDRGLYSVLVANDQTPGQSTAPVTLTVLVDRDGDGMPDGYETARGFNADDPRDAGRDADGDGATNLEEYRAGTDPRDDRSVLRLLISVVPDGWRLDFTGAANRTYNVMAAGVVGLAAERSIAAFVATSGEEGQVREMEAIDLEEGGLQERYYWVECPARTVP